MLMTLRVTDVGSSVRGTLQEISRYPIIGGDTGDEELRERFVKKLSSLKKIDQGSLYGVLSEMQKRVSTHSVDKIAGMAYLLGQTLSQHTMKPSLKTMHG